ncbi:acetyl coenzyme A synthetase (ADP forming), alpha domain-containing protein [Plasmodium fragile]|uniref:Acetyl coenzyme A synthetase (ADP forming), alpha domain-containing protein n=1 Tax=Plasmodium fragile TaxID=5857 RepID=A0A0D9QPI4_PLAFR|nr:acetyl coenzyme A synthetase (ADP forming), alpha domain-containing protein [Plasmodium fragile]KJP88974.1 acetyl coenzyme A synthetase (ADP forming), alpha domain-containing protein [Plasmodium fragile]
MILSKRSSKLGALRNYYSVWVGYNQNVQQVGNFKNSLNYLFKPKSIGVIGATERVGSVGNSIVKNLMQGEETYKLYFVNRKGGKVYDRDSYKTIGEVPEENIDLAVIAVPRDHVLGVMKELNSKNVKGVVIVTAGFKETGSEGIKLEQQIIDVAKNNGIRIIGPNCLGIIHSYHNMNASFADNKILKGNFSLLSQSGAICSAALDLSLQHNIGFSHFISVGSMCDVQFYELVEYLFYDMNTKYILLYVESIGDMNKFMAVCKKVCLYKPIILLKSGKTAKAAEAAISHTGSMVGNYEIFYASMKKLGVLVVDNFEELFNMCKILNLSSYPETNEVCVVTNAGGPGVLLVDNITRNDGNLSKLNEDLKKKLDSFLPPSWSKANPVDILGDASPVLYKKTVDALIKDNQFKNIIILLSPQSVTEPMNTAKEIINVKDDMTKQGKLILCNYLGGTSLEESTNLLNKNNIPTFIHPEHSAQNLLKLYKNMIHIQNLYEEIPTFLADAEQNHYVNGIIYKHHFGNTTNFGCGEAGQEQAGSKQQHSSGGSSGGGTPEDIIQNALKNKNYILNEFDSKKILQAYGIPTVSTEIFHTLEDIQKNISSIAFPCAMKIYSDTITHKKDIGGVILNIKNQEELIEAYKTVHENVKKHKVESEFKGVTIQTMMNTNDGIELILGYYFDANFGPVLLFGSGGSYVEIFKDNVLLIPPLSYSYTHHTMKETKIYHALLGKSSRFKKCDMPKLISQIMNFADLIMDLVPYINECDINPLFVSGSDIVALDARFTLRKNVNVDSFQSAKSNPLYSSFAKKYPVDMVFFGEDASGDNTKKGDASQAQKKGASSEEATSPLHLPSQFNSITRSIHPYDVKLMHAFLQSNAKELHQSTFFFTTEDSIKTKLFAFELCNADYDLYNVILHMQSNKVTGLVKTEKRQDANHCYTYATDAATFTHLMQKLHAFSMKQNCTSNFVYLKKDSPFAEQLKSMSYALDYEQGDVACYVGATQTGA